MRTSCQSPVTTAGPRGDNAASEKAHFLDLTPSVGSHLANGVYSLTLPLSRGGGGDLHHLHHRPNLIRPNHNRVMWSSSPASENSATVRTRTPDFSPLFTHLKKNRLKKYSEQSTCKKYSIYTTSLHFTSISGCKTNRREMELGQNQVQINMM